MISLLYAEGVATAAKAQPEVPFFMHPIPLFVVFLIFFYFLMIRPQNQKAKALKKMINELKKGDRIITSSGFYAVIVGVGESNLDIKLSENVKARIQKSAVSEVLTTPESATLPVAVNGEIVNK